MFSKLPSGHMLLSETPQYSSFQSLAEGFNIFAIFKIGLGRMFNFPNTAPIRQALILLPLRAREKQNA